MAARNPSDLWRDLVDESGDDAIDRAAGAAVADAERDLRAAGVDVAREHAQASALLDTLGKDDAPAPGPRDPDPAVETAAWVSRADPPRRRSPGAHHAWLLAAALALAAAGGAIYALGRRSKPIDAPVDVPREGPTSTVTAPNSTANAPPTERSPRLVHPDSKTTPRP